MKEFSTELKVGIFAIIVILVLSYMTFKVGSLPFLWEKGYRLYVVFDDISGLDEKSRVKIAGVEAGIVDSVTLVDGKARLTLLINPDIKIYRNATAYLRMTGLLGDKYVALSTGTPDEPPLRSGDTIAHAVPAANIDRLANQLSAAASHVSELTASINNVFGETQREEIRESIHNLTVLTRNLRNISTDNREPLNRIIAQLDEFTKSLGSKGPRLLDNMDRIVSNINDKGPALMDNLSRASNELREVLEENRETLREGVENFREVSRSIGNIARGIERGEGTMGKLVTDKKLYESLSSVSEEARKSLEVLGRLKTFMEFRTEYNTDESVWKGYFDLTLRPGRDKYYILGIVSDPNGSVQTTYTTIDGVTTTEEEIKDQVEFSAQFAKRFEDFALRIGLMENTFGFGADYFFYSDRGRLKFDIWDLSAKEAGADRAHARVGLDYGLFKYVFISSGVDNLLNSSRRGIYVGGGVSFEDRDFKYLIGKLPGLSLP